MCMYKRKEGSNMGFNEKGGSGWKRSLIIRFKIIIILVSFFTIMAAVNFYPDHYSSMYIHFQILMAAAFIKI